MNPETIIFRKDFPVPSDPRIRKKQFAQTSLPLSETVHKFPKTRVETLWNFCEVSRRKNSLTKNFDFVRKFSNSWKNQSQHDFISSETECRFRKNRFPKGYTLLGNFLFPKQKSFSESPISLKRSFNFRKKNNFPKSHYIKNFKSLEGAIFEKKLR